MKKPTAAEFAQYPGLKDWFDSIPVQQISLDYLDEVRKRPGAEHLPKEVLEELALNDYNANHPIVLRAEPRAVLERRRRARSKDRKKEKAEDQTDFRPDINQEFGNLFDALWPLDDGTEKELALTTALAWRARLLGYEEQHDKGREYARKVERCLAVRDEWLAAYARRRPQSPIKQLAPLMAEFCKILSDDLRFNPKDDDGQLIKKYCVTADYCVRIARELRQQATAPTEQKIKKKRRAAR